MPDCPAKHGFYLRSAKQSAERLYGDTSVTIGQTISSLAELRDFITQLIAAADTTAQGGPPFTPRV